MSQKIKDQDADRTESLDNESRLHDRTPCSENTHFLAKQRLYQGRIRNFSPGGTYIETSGYFTVGQQVTVAGPFDTDGQERKKQGAIVRKDGHGIGVKFKKQPR